MTKPSISGETECPICLNKIQLALKDSVMMPQKGMVHILCFENLLKGEQL